MPILEPYWLVRVILLNNSMFVENRGQVTTVLEPHAERYPANQVRAFFFGIVGKSCPSLSHTDY